MYEFLNSTSKLLVGTECYNKLVAEFNDNGDLLESDGRINRSVLGRKVFDNPDQLEKLQRITWPGTTNWFCINRIILAE